jgi:hypothetical protein
VERLNLSRTVYCFAILTIGSFGASALHQLDDLIFARTSRHPDAAFTVRMAGNFVPFYEPAYGAKREKIPADADKRLAEIASKIDTGLTVRRV